MKSQVKKIKNILASTLRLLSGSRRLHFELDHMQKHLGDIVSHLNSLSSNLSEFQSSLAEIRQEQKSLTSRLNYTVKSLDAIELAVISAKEVRFPDPINYADLFETETKKWATIFNSISNHIPRISSDQSVLEMHCGLGKLLFNKQVPNDCKYIGLDSSDLMLRGAKELHKTKKAEFHSFSKTTLNNLKSSCDVAFFGDNADDWSIGELLADTDRMVASLKTGGILVFVLRCDNTNIGRNVDLLKKRIETNGLNEISVHSCLHDSSELTLVLAK